MSGQCVYGGLTARAKAKCAALRAAKNRPFTERMASTWHRRAGAFFRLVSAACLMLAFSAGTATAVWAAEEPAADSHGEHSDADHGGGHHDEYDLSHANGGPDLERPEELRSDLAIYTAVVFLLLLAILWKFAWGPICEALDRREQRISDAIAAAEAKHQESKELLGQYEDKLAHAADQVRELLEEARRDAEHTKAEILAEAKSAAQAEHDRSMRDLKNATDGALKQIAESGSRLAIDLAGKIVERELSAKDHDRLIRDAVASFPSEN